MRFERMADDELKRFLLLDVQSLETALALQEAARRYLRQENSIQVPVTCNSCGEEDTVDITPEDWL